ncbi:tRNA-dihydrouridine synthase [Candidatus Kaiserbacteria bacterium CG10_big_fil_rev_8_21_14_0_10_45_20]|uniref:tRNA-dihydrouridine synthase n=1 Tax=Candidatus Kaiserbacteria bacterium CG10_big_fil_rev_8_21_14_0_10_45_20 TaxID=1974607 RepID=A0A2H0UHF2_9BACT|nr:MAG: tRNA-dihydrouridine synthase [Candidatus Kaiserbacteria bacterium CG10_big_fil_rev_8_21_14_0_10_45_20]
MAKGFWKECKKPIMALAPMADVTDPAFRAVIARYGKPDVMWTEFVSADGLVRAPEEGRRKLLADLQYKEEERPIVAQFFTSNPDHMEQVARLAVELGFDGIDINMGCPDRSIEKQGAGAGHIKDPDRAVAVIEAAQRGAGDTPVSVKTRLGYNKDELEEWLPRLLETNISALTLHVRTRKEMSKVPARWERVGRAVELRDKLAQETLILGNGDVVDIADARQKVAESGADGAMLGRAIFGNPWLFSNVGRPTSNISLKERLEVMVEHTKLFEEMLPHKNFAIMKKHYKAYVSGFEGASDLRVRLMEAENAATVEEIVSDFLSNA